MFKKIASIALAAMLVGTTALVAGAAENDEAVAAADDSAVAAADDSAVAAAEDSESTGDGKVIYFDAGSSGWNNFSVITFFLVDHSTGTQLITWGSKKGNMTKGDGDVWSFDLEKAGFDLSSGGPYGCNFTADWGMQTCDLIITTDNYGDTAYNNGEQVENNVDSNKKSSVVKWRSGKNGNPICITSIGNLIGDAYWPGEDAVSVFYKFISTTDASSIKNATKFNGKTEQQTIDDTAKALKLTLEQVTEQVKKAKDAGAELDWDASKSSLSSGGGSDNNGNTNTNNNNSGSGSSGSSSSGSSSSTSGSSSSTSTVTSGEGTTVYFIIGGVMLAAIGVFFLARKRREF